MRRFWFATSAAVCLSAAAAVAPVACAQAPVYGQQPAQPSWSQRMLAPFGGGQSAEVKKQQTAVADAKAREAQRLSFDPLALDNPTGPPNPGLYVSMAEMSSRGGNIPQARQFYQKALALEPNNLDALLGAARMEDREGHMDVAVMLYQRAANAFQNNATVMNDLGLCLARQGKLAEAERALTRAVQLEPRKSLYRNNMAKVLVELNCLDAAEASMAAVSAPPVVNYNMGVLLHQRGRDAEAERYLNAAIAADARMQPARILLAQMHPAPPVYQTARATQPAPPAYQTARATQPAPRPSMIVESPVTSMGAQTTTVEEPITPTPESSADQLPQIINTGAAAIPEVEGTPTLLPPVN